MAAEPKRARGLDTGGNVHGRLGKAAWGTATHHLITSPVCARESPSLPGTRPPRSRLATRGGCVPHLSPATYRGKATHLLSGEQSRGSWRASRLVPARWQRPEPPWPIHGTHTARAPTLSSPPPAPKLESCVQEVARGGEVRPEGSKGRWPWTEPPRSPGLSLWARGPKTTQDGEGQACSVGKIRGAWRTGWDERGSCHATPGPSARGGAG